MIENVLLLKLVHTISAAGCSGLILEWPVLVVLIAILALMIFKPTLW